jgi:hypothetical protein
LESTGTQWIDTGVVEASPSNFAIAINKISGSFSFGFCHANVTSGTWLGMRSYLGKAYYKSYYDTVSFSDDEPIYFKWDGSKGFYINGIKVGSFTASVGSDSISACSWPVFGMRDFAYALAVNNIYSCKIGQITIWQSGTLVRDMIPVRFTNELGQSEGAMYDRASGQLFRNQGKGAFLYGPDKR